VRSRKEGIVNGVDTAWISVNGEAMKLVHEILENPAAVGATVTTLENGATVIDVGQKAPGGWVAGRYYSLITMGGLGEFSYETFPTPIAGVRLPAVRVMVDFPQIACTASQIAGWRLEGGDPAPILSGPARALNKQPDRYIKQVAYRDSGDEAVIAMQTGAPVRATWAETIARECQIETEKVFILVAANASLVTAVQVAARSVEQAIHRLEEEGLPMEAICSAQGICVVPPLADDDLTAMGRINDGLLYGSEATFYLRYEDDEFVRALAREVVSEASETYGRPFADIFEAAGRDFYNIPTEIHSPAVVHLNNLTSGRTHSAGEINVPLLAHSFFGEVGS